MKPACLFLIQNRGERVFSFRKAWEAACKAANIPGVLFHDLCRTAMTNMIEAGFSEKEAMSVTGRKTRAIFDRYHIVSSKRLQEMGARLEAHLTAKEKAARKKAGKESVN